MRFVPTIIHGIADYLVSFLVILVPFILSDHGLVHLCYGAIGLVGIAYSLMTDYELGLVRRIGMKTHLGLDSVFVMAMVLVPMLLVVPTTLQWFSFIVACMALILVLTTKTEKG